MPLFLTQRDTESTERMDDPNCDPAELENTYMQFGWVNSLISRWEYIYKREIRPLLKYDEQNSILDIGFGGGDIPIKLARWASDDGFDLRITAIDPDPRAFNFVQKNDRPENVEFLQCEISELDPENQKFDFVISNHVLHHLTSEQLDKMLNLSKKLSKKVVIMNDGRRSDWAYLLFNIFSRPIFRSSFITEDGLTSIKRSYTTKELISAVPNGWQVKPLFPFRLLLMYHHE
jgi:2-polyprenyl-3-methyl-5-hydroxy-6-metoxy-1,4-benzoquinol methylase